MSGIQVDKEALRAKGAEIAEIDVVLDAQSGSKAAGKRAIRNRLVAESADTDAVSAVVSRLRENFDGDSLIATFYALVEQLENEFGDEAEQFVTEAVESNTQEDAEKLSDEQVAELQETRKTKVQEFKALANILEMFGQDISDIPEPKVRRGSRGPRGPRTLSKFQYAVDGKDLDEDVNSLATVAKLCNVKVGELKEHITSQGVDLKNPPAEWEADLPNDMGRLSATPLPEFADDFSEDEESETDAA